jgi:N-acetyl-anhydromuramyl-L-alanine amidase AmpD
VISRSGVITQLVPFHHIAWHAGYAYWENLPGLNRYSIGIELDKDGALKPGPGGSWVSEGGQIYPESEVLVAMHWKNFTENGWKTFPDVQLQAALRAARAIIDHYKLIDVLGHEDVHIAKVDPGPAFPMSWFRRELFGREEPIVKPYVAARPLRTYKDVDGKPPIRLLRRAKNTLLAETPDSDKSLNPAGENLAIIQSVCII